MIRPTLILALTLTSCAPFRSASQVASPSPTQEIVYSSTDLRHVTVFSPDGVRYGPPLDYRPGHPPPSTRYVARQDGVHCILIGIPGNTTEYAIKRPIRTGARYQCDRTSFRVTRCVENCTAAVIEYDSRSADNLGAPEGYMYVDSCLGILVFSSVSDLAEAIPLSAEVSRGEVGVLADPTYPNCRPS